VWLKTTTRKAKAVACRSKVYVYYDEFKVIFLMLLVGLELRTRMRVESSLMRVESTRMRVEPTCSKSIVLRAATMGMQLRFMLI
jgi:hypothetical protein